MHVYRTASLVLALSSSVVGCGSDENNEPTSANDAGTPTEPGERATGLDPDEASVASVDRFQDSFGKLFKRSGPAFNPSEVSKVVPEPNEPIDMENFLVTALGPEGEPVVYYSLDIVADEPAAAYVFVDKAGKAIADQLPIIDGLPGDPTYNDFVLITEVTVGDDYVANSLTDFDGVEDAEKAGDVTLEETTRIENWAVVPEGTTAKRKFVGKSPVGYRAWSNSEVAHYLRFDTNLVVTSGGKIPTSPIIVIFKNDMSPAEGFLADDDGMTHNVVATVPGQPGYSSYWDHSVGNASGFDDVTDLASALDNVREKVPVIVNCPIVE